MKLGSKADAFQRRGQAWFCTTGLPSDITVEVREMTFHLHKFPLLSKSRVLEKMFEEKSVSNEEDGNIVDLSEIPGGAKSFELVAKFCYGLKLELSASDVVYLRCASEHLQMTEEVTENNLISHSETFLNQIVLRNWKDSLKALNTCDKLLPYTEDLHIVKRCIESLAVKACTDPNLFGWPVLEHGPMQSPGGSVLWNGISTGAKPRSFSSDWWYEDISGLSFPLYKRLISVMGSRGIKQEIISGSIAFYARKYLPGLRKRQSPAPIALATTTLTEEEQKDLLEEICNLLPIKKGVVSTKFLFGLLRIAIILKANPLCMSNLEKRLGMQLEEASLDDLIMPTFSYSMETLYNVDCVQRMLEHFLEIDRVANGGASPYLVEDEEMVGSSPSMRPLTCVARLIDGYLAEVAPDANLKMPLFQALAAAVPDYARPLDDGLYRAIDIYLKAHPWLPESEREQLCRLMDCQKLSLEACTHAAQNERLPLRVIVQVLFFEQLQLRSSIAGCFLVSDNLNNSGPHALTTSGGLVVGPTEAARENLVLKFGMDSMRMKVSELEKEYTTMKRELEKLGGQAGKNGGGGGGAWSSITRKFRFKMLKSHQMCSAQEGPVSGRRSNNEKVRLAKLRRHKRSKSMDK